MKKSTLAIALGAIMLFSVSASARMGETLPLLEDFENYTTSSVSTYGEVGYRTTKSPSSSGSYFSLENGKLKVKLLADGTKNITATKTLGAEHIGIYDQASGSYAGSEFTFECDFQITGNNYFYNYNGPFVLIDSNGTETPLFKVTSVSNGTYGGNGSYLLSSNRFTGFNWSLDTVYKIKAEVNLKSKTFALYIDSGSGYQRMTTAGGTSTFTYNGVDLKSFRIGFLSNGSSDVTYYVDNIKIDIPNDYVYVSKNGSDSNSGTEASPLATIEAAYAKAKSKLSINNKNVLVRLGSGSYIFDNTYTLGDLDRNKDYSKVAFAPDNVTDISFTGDVKVDIEKLDEVANETLRDRFIEDVKENYVRSYDSFPLEIADVAFSTTDTEVTASTKVTASGRVSQRACLVTALYDTDNRLVSIKTDATVVEPGKSDTLTTTSSLSVLSDGGSIKTFILEDLGNMMPLVALSMPEAGFTQNIKSTSITNATYTVSGEAIIMSGTGAANSRVGLKVASGNNIVYIDQIKTDANGAFSKTMNLKYIPFTESVIYISSDGGAN